MDKAPEWEQVLFREWALAMPKLPGRRAFAINSFDVMCEAEKQHAIRPEFGGNTTVDKHNSCSLDYPTDGTFSNTVGLGSPGCGGVVAHTTIFSCTNELGSVVGEEPFNNCVASEVL